MEGDSKVKKHHRMQFDPNNNVIKLCARGMEMEGQGKVNEAGKQVNQCLYLPKAFRTNTTSVITFNSGNVLNLTDRKTNIARKILK